eukprot:TRINITY_DN1400_c0_g2_i2.p1 TRINITY_DN1400_c0_g2~~TRINITY_DN1400_c0_g2_i2.p1  ORF type:complete len:1020 (+),score=186.62 TRINITY_DN1400_c0_g2_i2:237-3296(+)
MEDICALLNKIINTTALVYDFHSQVLSTLTTILIVLEVKERQSLAFESFIELLFDIVSNVNSSPDRVLRGAACQCLLELEETYPGLLCAGLGHFFSFAQKENTHVSMEYTSLFEAVLKHHLLTLCPTLDSQEGATSKLQRMISSGSSGSFLALFSVRDPLCPFAIPTDLVDPSIMSKRTDIGSIFASPPESMEALDLEPLKLFSKDIKLAIQFLAGASQRRMTKWSQARTVWSLASLVKTCAVNLDIFRLHFRSLMYSYDLIQVHTMAVLLSLFLSQNIFTEEDFGEFLGRGMKQLSDPETPAEGKYLVYWWVHHLSQGLNYPHFSPKFRLDWSFPTILDHPLVREAKLVSLATRLLEDSKSGSEVSKLSPAGYIKAFKSIREFKSHLPNSEYSVSAFKALHAFLCVPYLFDETAIYLAKSIQANPALVVDLSNLIELLRREHPEVKHKLLFSLNQWMSSSTKDALESPSFSLKISHEPTKFSYFMDLMLLIVADQFIQISGLLSEITSVLKSSDLCPTGDWTLGNKILKVVKSALSKHNTNLIFNTLTSLLLFLGVYYKNVDIRDRAHFYYMMLTHLPKDRMDLVLLSPVYLAPSQDISVQEGIKKKDTNVDFPILLMEKLKIEDETTTKKERDPDAPHVELDLDAESILRVHYEFVETRRKNKKLKTKTSDPSVVSDLSVVSDPSVVSAPSAETTSDVLDDALVGISKPLGGGGAGVLNQDVASIKLNLLLHYDQKIAAKLEPNMASMMGVNFKFSSSPMYDQIEPLDIPFISLPPSDASDKERLSFPHAYKLTITTSPLVPIPASFNVSMSFNDQEGTVHTNCPVSPLHINFEDLLLPVPVPKEYEDSQEQYISLLFKELWSYISKKEGDSVPGNIFPAHKTQSSEWIQDSTDDDGSSDVFSKRKSQKNWSKEVGDDAFREKLFCTSVKFLEIKKEKMLAVVDTFLKKYLVSGSSTTEEEKEKEEETLDVLIFLPRAYHLLMKLKIEETQTLITIKTDYWRVLTYIDCYLEDIIKK